MKDIETLTTLANDRTPFTDLDWRKKLLKQIENPAAKPFVRQALAHMREMEAGIRSNSPLFTREHAREARSHIRTLLSQALAAVRTIKVTDQVMSEIAQGARQIDGTQKAAFKIYKGVPITITNLAPGQERSRLQQLLNGVDVQGYPVYMNQRVIGINVKKAAKELSNVVLPVYDGYTAHHLDFVDSTALDKKALDLAKKYKALSRAQWEIVSGKVFRVKDAPTAYIWIVGSPKLAEFIGTIASGNGRHWSVATFVDNTIQQQTEDQNLYTASFIQAIFTAAKQMKRGPSRRIDYDGLSEHYDVPVDIIRGLLDGKIQTNITGPLATDLKAWRR